MLKNKNLRWLWLSVVVILLDQLTKNWVVRHFSVGESRQINSLLNIRLAHNTGSAFSFLSQAGGWQRWFFIILVIVVSIVILVWLARLPKKQNFQSCALALILGGALGNLWDRLQLGYVNDFVDFHVKTWHFATFNIADSAITIGVIMLLLTLLLWKK